MFPYAFDCMRATWSFVFLMQRTNRGWIEVKERKSRRIDTYMSRKFGVQRLLVSIVRFCWHWIHQTLTLSHTRTLSLFYRWIGCFSNKKVGIFHNFIIRYVWCRMFSFLHKKLFILTSLLHPLEQNVKWINMLINSQCIRSSSRFSIQFAPFVSLFSNEFIFPMKIGLF